MIRLAIYKDIPWLIEQMLLLKQETGWKNENGAYTHDTLRLWLNERLYDPFSVCYVWQADDGALSAFCGVSESRMVQPPHLPFLYEWGWRGLSKPAAACWRACCIWGTKRGLVYGYRVTPAVTMHSRRVCESVTWERL